MGFYSLFMNLQTLQTILDLKGLTHSDLARLAGVSRQAVSLWFQKAKGTGQAINLHTKTHRRLAESLGMSMDDLSSPFPLYEQEEQIQKLESVLLWDRLYASLHRFVGAVIREQPQALARLVQVYGLFQAAKIAGRAVWKKFPKYKKHLEPVQRANWERVWILQKNLGLI